MLTDTCRRRRTNTPIGFEDEDTCYEITPLIHIYKG